MWDGIGPQGYISTNNLHLRRKDSQSHSHLQSSWGRTRPRAAGIGAMHQAVSPTSSIRTRYHGMTCRCYNTWRSWIEGRESSCWSDTKVSPQGGGPQVIAACEGIVVEEIVAGRVVIVLDAGPVKKSRLTCTKDAKHYCDNWLF
jgi:hypothetical protein